MANISSRPKANTGEKTGSVSGFTVDRAAAAHPYQYCFVGRNGAVSRQRRPDGLVFSAPIIQAAVRRALTEERKLGAVSQFHYQIWPCRDREVCTRTAPQLLR